MPIPTVRCVKSDVTQQRTIQYSRITLRRNPLGYVIAAPLLILVSILAAWLLARTLRGLSKPV